MTAKYQATGTFVLPLFAAVERGGITAIRILLKEQTDD